MEEQTPPPPPTSTAAETTTDEAVVLSFDEFLRVDLRVAQITAAERIEKSEKLVKLQLDVGPLGERQIVAGIAKHYAAEELIGRKIVIVANLKPAKLMGVPSQGMLLAASDDAGNLELLSPGAAMPPGSTVR
ncbi:MAG: methionine--tRNA ligase subunit beta [Bdellovibrionales bacterium]|nr:methionine--tRNA ligase subunit beta [Bdellovibrionales bacterium]